DGRVGTARGPGGAGRMRADPRAVDPFGRDPHAPRPAGCTRAARAGLPASRRGWCPAAGCSRGAEDASVRRREGVRAGTELLGRGAARGDRAALRSRPRGEGRQPAPAELELERTLVAITRST